jgi:uncharacterized protein with HEPN domain
MNRDYKVYLRDILECIERVEEYTSDMSYEDFINDQKTVDAISGLRLYVSIISLKGENSASSTMFRNLQSFHSRKNQKL